MMMRKQSRIGRWMAVASLATATTGAVPAAAEDWLGLGDSGPATIASGASANTADPPSPEGLDEAADPGAGPGLLRAGYDDASEAVVEGGAPVADEGTWGMGDMTGWVADRKSTRLNSSH